MNWYERMNEAIDYIEDNLRSQIDFGKISKIVGQSSVNFQRTFGTVADISIFEYIRRRKLTLAAFDLQNSSEKVIDIALKYGYESPEAFARAFKDLHGASPSNARKYGLSLKAFPRITFLLSVKGDAVMEYRIENKEAFSVYGIEEIFDTDSEKTLKDIPAFWQKSWKTGKCDELLRSTNDPSSSIHAICCYKETGENTFPYMIFAHKTKNCSTGGFSSVDVPAATWAIFKSENHTLEQTSGVIQSLNRRVYTDWLPTASYRKIDGYELEMYYCAGNNEFYAETWIRVEPK